MAEDDAVRIEFTESQDQNVIRIKTHKLMTASLIEIAKSEGFSLELFHCESGYPFIVDSLPFIRGCL